MNVFFSFHTKIRCSLNDISYLSETQNLKYIIKRVNFIINKEMKYGKILIKYNVYLKKLCFMAVKI